MERVLGWVVGDFEVLDRPRNGLAEGVNLLPTARAAAQSTESTAESKAGGSESSKRNVRSRENTMAQPSLLGEVC